MVLVETLKKLEGEQLEFKAFRLAETVSALLKVEAEKKEADYEWNVRIKALKKSMMQLSDEIESQRRPAE